MSGRHRSILWIAAVTSLVVVLNVPQPVTASWSWGGEKPAETQADKTNIEEPLVTAESMKLLTGEVSIDRVGSDPNATAVDEIVESILSSTREGRILNGYDEVLSDPSVAEAIQQSDDVSARNVIKDKLCDLGLMSCDFEDVEGKRPYLRPQDLIYAQPVAIRPVGKPIPSVPYQHGPPRGPPPPPRGSGPYGPPRPMPPPRKVGYEGPPHSSFANKGPYYSGPPSSGPHFSGPPSSGPGPFYSGSGSDSGIVYGSKPPGPIFEGPEPPPYSFESHSANKIHTLQSVERPTVLETPSNAVQQHVHHHYHHGEDGATKIAVPVPVPVLGSHSSTLISNELNSHAFSSSAGGFNPIGNDLKTAHSLNGLHTNSFGGGSAYGNGAKPIFEGSNIPLGISNQGPATFSSPSDGGFSGNGGLYSSQTGSYHTSNSDLYKNQLNGNGPLQTNGLSNYASNQQSYASGNYYSPAAGGDRYQGFETARQENFDCVCVPYEQCPAHDIIGRKDDGHFLAVDPRNTKSNIEALGDEAVITDGNGTMTVVRVTKDTKNGTAEEDTTSKPEDEPKKISKRDVSEKKADSKSDDGKANVEPVSISLSMQIFFYILTLYARLLYLQLNHHYQHSNKPVGLLTCPQLPPTAHLFLNSSFISDNNPDANFIKCIRTQELKLARVEERLDRSRIGSRFGKEYKSTLKQYSKD